MKRCLIPIILLFALTACSPGQLFGPTLTPSASPTDTATPTLTPTQTSTQTYTPSATATLDIATLFYHGLPPEEDLDNYHVETSQEDPILAYLENHPPIFDEAAPDVDLSIGKTSGSSVLYIRTNIDGVNAAPVAYYSTYENGFERRKIMWAIKNADDSIGYLRGYFADFEGGPDMPFRPAYYSSLMENITSNKPIILYTAILVDSPSSTLFYINSLYLQDRYLELLTNWLSTGIIPGDLQRITLFLRFW